MTPPEGYCGTADAARALGLSQRQVQTLSLRLGLGMRIGRMIVLAPMDLAILRARETRPGKRPTKGRDQHG